MTLEQEIRKKQKESFAKMTPGQKLSYIFGYYKWHILAAVAFVIIVTSVTRDLINGNRPVFVNILLVNASPWFDPEERLKGDIASRFNVNTDEYRIDIDSSVTIGDPQEMSPVSVASAQKLMALYAAGETDVMIAPESVIDIYLQAGIFADPTAFLSESELKALESKGYELCYRKQSEMSDEDTAAAADAGISQPSEDRDVCVGIIVDNSSYLKEIGAFSGFSEHDKTHVIFTFSPVSPHPENAAAFLKMITEGPDKQP